MAEAKMHRPPKSGRTLLSFLLNHSHPESILADMEEIFHEIEMSKGLYKAIAWYWLQIILSIPTFLNNSFYWSATMIKNYFTIALRNLKKNKIYSAINIFGLAIGIACCILIFFFVNDEFNYDRFNKNIEKIYEVKAILKFGNAMAVVNAQPPLGPELSKAFPEIENAARISKGKATIRNNGNFFEEEGIHVDPSFFDIFSISLTSGVKNKALADYHNVVLSSAMSKKYFGASDPMGKTIAIKLNNEFQDFIVTGVTEKIPENSSIQFSFLLNIEGVAGDALLEWNSGKHYPTFIMLADNADVTELLAKFPETIDNHLQQNENISSKHVLQPFADYHLKARWLSNVLVNHSKIVYSYILMGIALLVLLIACFNFTNLSIGSASGRLKEIGMRKVLGAQRKHLARQFLFETIVISTIALIVGLALTKIFLPIFNSLSQKSLHMDFLSNLKPLMVIIGLTSFVGIIAGGYPSIVLSRFPSVDLFKGKFRLSGKNIWSKVLIIFQFSISIFLITTTIFMYKQNQFMLRKNLGYETEKTIRINLGSISSNDKTNKSFFEVFKNRLLQNPMIKSVSASGYSLTDFWMASAPELKEETRRVLIDYNNVDFDYIETLGIQLMQGRNFSQEFPGDITGSAIVNESFVKRFNLESAIGMQVTAPFKESTFGSMSDYKIIGVVKDFHYQSLEQSIGPAFMFIGENNPYRYIYVKAASSSTKEFIEFIKTEYTSLLPDSPIKFSFLDDQVKQQYEMENRWGKMITYASVFAIMIACSGLFGLTLLITVRRTKEIGIRKVLGASIPNIARLINREFFWLVLSANIIAWPLAYFAMNTFLKNYAYRIHLSPVIFVLAGSLALMIAVLTISFHAIRAARVNPVRTLKYE